VGSWGNWLLAAGPGRLNVAVQPAAAASPPLGHRMIPRWASESVCLYRKPLTDSSSWMRGLARRSAGRAVAPLGALWATIPEGGSGRRSLGHRPSIRQMPSARLCASDQVGPGGGDPDTYGAVAAVS
jgi:hypothetical protein